MSDRWPITWHNQLVGWIESPRWDMPFYYGRWVPVDGPASAEFLAALRQAVDAGDGLDVVVAENLPGTAYCHPDDDEGGEIDVRSRWRG